MSEHPFTNELIHESSPYLLEHAHNPVNWYPWGAKALAKAKAENKPLIISIGYSSCHWCHVMEHESYADTAVANLMNKYFVAIKIDREERPDIDQIYMDAAMLISGNGGWPLNAFALPDGRPFYAATYFPKDQWLDLLHQIEHVYRTQHANVVAQAENLTQGINRPETLHVSENVTDTLQIQFYNAIFNSWQPLIDFKLGGFARAPKFPLPVGWEFLLQYYYITHNENALKAVTTTLNSMAMGGIYDQAGGGFARYATDANWQIPHFEKMLYDNGQLVSLYAHAYQLTKNQMYADIVDETLEFISRELTHPQGGFYASLNADSEGEEGLFYVWTYAELEHILGKEGAQLCCAYFQVSPSGNWENGHNILFCNQTKESFAASRGMDIASFTKVLCEWKEKIMTARNQRIRPTTDHKILTSWNALMMKGYIDAYKALGKKEYLDAALKNATFLQQQMIREDGMLWRNYKDGKANIAGFLDDYALLAEAFIALYQVTFNIHWLQQAKALTDYAVQHFYDTRSQLFFYTSNSSESLVARKMEVPDNVMPSSNSVMAKNLYTLAAYFDIPAYANMSHTMLQAVTTRIADGGPYYANWSFLLGLGVTQPVEVAIMGEEALQKSLQMQQHYIPTALFMGGSEENLPLLEMKKTKGATTIYVCKSKVCQLPVSNVEEALKLVYRK